MNSFRIEPTGPFNLEHSSRFLCGFTPGAGTSCANDDALVMGFLSDDTFEPTVVSVKQVDGSIHGELARSGDAGTIRAQVARILSLDHDASGLAKVAKKDKVIASLLSKQPGFRPVCFPSPYEAAIWGVLAQRVRMVQASNVKRKLAIETDSAVEGFGRTFFPSPKPEALLKLKSFPSISEEKMDRLHAIARAALDGKLDPDRLRAMSRENAIEDLQKLRGIGPWTAGHIFLRGSGIADELPGMEPRVLAGVAKAYKLRRPTFGQLVKISDGWRPFRMWISVLIVSTNWTNPKRS